MTGFEIPWLQFLLGGTLFLLPGITWVWALGGELRWPQRLPLVIVTAFTVSPATVYFLNLFLNVPLSLAAMTFATAALALLGLAMVLLRRVGDWLQDPAPQPRQD